MGGKYKPAIAASVEIQFFSYARATDISLTTCELKVIHPHCVLFKNTVFHNTYTSFPGY